MHTREYRYSPTESPHVRHRLPLTDIPRKNIGQRHIPTEDVDLLRGDRAVPFGACRSPGNDGRQPTWPNLASRLTWSSLIALALAICL